MSTSKEIFDRLNRTLGFDPSKRAGPNASAVEKALKAHQEKRQAQAEAAAVQIIDKLVDISEKKAAIDKEYKKASEAVDKEIGKLEAELMRVSSNKPQVEETEADTAPVAKSE